MTRLAVVKGNPMPLTMDDRIREVLSSPDRADTQNVEALAAEVKQELQRVGSELRDAEEVLVDPVATPSAIAAAGKVIEAGALTQKRLTAALNRLDRLHTSLVNEASHRKYREAYDAAEVERDELARLLRTRYPALCGELVQLLSAITDNDKRIKQFEGLHSAEFVTRAVRDGYYRGTNGMVAVGTLSATVRLPALSGLDQAGGRFAWPPRSTF